MQRLIEGNLGGPPRISPTSVKAVLLYLFVPVAMMAQIYPPVGGGGGYPGGGYPGQSPYPGQRQPTGSGIPIPGRNGKNNKGTPTKAGQPLPNFRGTLKVFEEKS